MQLAEVLKKSPAVNNPILAPHGEYFQSKEGIKARSVVLGMFNTTRITTDSHIPVFYVGRVITEKAQQQRGMDKSKLWIARPHSGDLQEFDPKAPPGIVNVEDPRSLESIIGVTAVHEQKEGEPLQFSPGLIEVAVEDGKLIATYMRVLTNPDSSHLQARNVTPIAVNEGEVTFLARREDAEYNHTLSIFVAKGDKAYFKRNIIIPIFSWNSKKTGTTGAPLHMDNDTYWLFVHGQRVVDDASDQREYSLGVIEMSKEGVITRMTSQPVITRRDVPPFDEELRKENIVAYSTDSPTREGDEIRLLVNVGDIDTSEVLIPVEVIEKKFTPISTNRSKSEFQRQ